MEEEATHSTMDTIIDSLKAPFSKAEDVPAAKPLYTALIYGSIGVLIGRAL